MYVCGFVSCYMPHVLGAFAYSRRAVINFVACVRLSVCPHVSAGLTLGAFSSYFTLESFFIIICRENPKCFLKLCKKMGNSPEGLSRFCYWCGTSHKIIVGSNIYYNDAKKNTFLHFHFWQRRMSTMVREPIVAAEIVKKTRHRACSNAPFCTCSTGNAKAAHHVIRTWLILFSFL